HNGKFLFPDSPSYIKFMLKSPEFKGIPVQRKVLSVNHVKFIPPGHVAAIAQATDQEVILFFGEGGLPSYPHLQKPFFRQGKVMTGREQKVGLVFPPLHKKVIDRPREKSTFQRILPYITEIRPVFIAQTHQELLAFPLTEVLRVGPHYSICDTAL